MKIRMIFSKKKYCFLALALLASYNWRRQTKQSIMTSTLSALPQSETAFANDAERMKKGPYTICVRRRSRSACAIAQADQDLHCPLTKSMDSVVYVDEQRMIRSDCTDTHADLDYRCLHMTLEPFSHVLHKKISNANIWQSSALPNHFKRKQNEITC